MGTKFDALNYSNYFFEEDQKPILHDRATIVMYPTQANFAKSKAKNKGIVIVEPNKISRRSDAENKVVHEKRNSIIQNHVNMPVIKKLLGGTKRNLPKAKLYLKRENQILLKTC